MSAYRKRLPYRKPKPYGGPGGAVMGAPNAAAGCDFNWDRAAAVDVAGSLPFRDVSPRGDSLAAPWSDIDGQHNELRDIPVRVLGTLGGITGLRWDEIAPRCEAIAVATHGPEPHDKPTDVRWADFDDRFVDTMTAPFGTPTPHNRVKGIRWGQSAAHNLSLSGFWRAIVARGGYVALPWGPIGARGGDIRIDWPVDPPPGTDPITVPILPVYVMIPTITAIRLSDSALLPILGVSLQCDLDSWAWSFTAPMAFSAKALVDPATATDPIEIAITINGYTWTLLVEGYEDNRRFGSKTLTIRGRSRSAMLAQPYAPSRTFIHGSDRTAAQLVDDELFGTGWTALWTAPDWLVPGGTFSYADLAPIDAISRIADSIGAAVLTHRTDLELQVVPQYADSPWAWGAATPYAILPAAILAAGDGSWQGGSNANGIVVRSQDASFAGLVKITGTDGASELEMVVDSLVVHADAGRERGRVLLAKAGKIKTETRTLPLFPSPADPGLIPLGALVEIEDATPDPEVFDTWRGMVRGIRIDAQKQGSANSVRQVLQLERQFR